MLNLYIANKNYSSWSLRPWVLMKELAIPFEEHLLFFGDEAAWADYRNISPSGLVPCLVDGDLIVWDSLAISEYLAEQYPAVWPSQKLARAWARCAAAEMHSGFPNIRTQCGMNCGLRVKLKSIDAALEKEIKRLDLLWSQGLDSFGGPFLAGQEFSAVDAFYAPVIFRIQTYDLSLSSTSTSYVQRILELKSMREWYQAGIQETWRDESHEQEIKLYGEIVSDIRAIST
ncbi:MAG: glutathione S-transferase family protein [Acidiferrobacterales bacterium]|nr:glutathione S-transferase family protein [Acidiferrobacterales bacterium]